MTLVTPDVGEAVMLANLLNKTASQNLVLKLFTNNVTPAESDTAATYTEASGSGYAAITLTGSSWTVTAGSPSSAAYPQQTFTFSGALGNVYGYFIVQVTSGILMWSELFAGAPFVIASGDLLKVTPSIQIS